MGPPCVMTLMVSNTWTDPRIAITVAKTTVGRISGRVMRVSLTNPRIPSAFVASSMLTGTVARPAKKIIIVNEAVRQTPTRATVRREVDGSPSQLIAPMPTKPSISLMKPPW